MKTALAYLVPMTVSEIQHQIQQLADDELKQISAYLVAERQKRMGVNLDEIVDRADREGRWVDWDHVKDEILAKPDPA